MYREFISLGYACVTTASLASLGVRSFSGPFDWLLADFSKICDLIENNFDEYLKYENLEIMPDSIPTFVDKKYGIIYPDEHFRNLEEEYSQIKEKYIRRANRFMENIREGGCCFVRTINSEIEGKFICENIKRIDRLFGDNDIVFIVPRYIRVKDIEGHRLFQIKDNWPMAWFQMGLKDYFGTCPEFKKFCVDNYPNEKRKDNLIFFQQAEINFFKRRLSIERLEFVYFTYAQSAWKETQIAKRNYEDLVYILSGNIDLSKIPTKCYIQGTGEVARQLFQLIKSVSDVKGFIDDNCDEQVFCDIPIIRLSDVSINDCVDIISTNEIDFIDNTERIKKELGDKAIVRYVCDI